ADTADDPLIHPIPDRFPKTHGLRLILLHQRRNALGSLPGKPLLDLGHQRTGYSLSPAFGIHRQSVDVTPPTIESADDRADDSAPDLGHENVGRAFGNGPPQIIGSIGHTGSGTGMSPEFQNAHHFLGMALPNDKTAHRLPHQMQKARSSLMGPRASSRP